MKINVQLFIGVLFLFVGTLLQLPAQAGTSAAQSQEGNDSQQAVEVEAATLENRHMYRSVFYGSRLRPRERYPQRAPISGTVETITVSPGQRVSSGDQLGSVRRDLSGRNYRSVDINAGRSGTVGQYDLQAGDPVQENQELFTILDISSLRSEIWVSDKDIGAVRPGDTAIVVENSNSSTMRGKVVSVSPEPDYESGLFKVEVEFRPQPSLFVGKFIRIELRKDPYYGLSVQSEHIERKYGKDHLFIIAGGVVELREVQTGARYDEMVTIQSGARAGEQYVISATRRISDGTPVIVTNSGE